MLLEIMSILVSEIMYIRHGLIPNAFFVCTDGYKLQLEVISTAVLFLERFYFTHAHSHTHIHIVKRFRLNNTLKLYCLLFSIYKFSINKSLRMNKTIIGMNNWIISLINVMHVWNFLYANYIHKYWCYN